jgi:hypothetical protein
MLERAKFQLIPVPTEDPFRLRFYADYHFLMGLLELGIDRPSRDLFLTAAELYKKTGRIEDLMRSLSNALCDVIQFQGAEDCYMGLKHNEEICPPEHLGRLRALQARRYMRVFQVMNQYEKVTKLFASVESDLALMPTYCQRMTIVFAIEALIVMARADDAIAIRDRYFVASGDGFLHVQTDGTTSELPIEFVEVLRFFEWRLKILQNNVISEIEWRANLFPIAFAEKGRFLACWALAHPALPQASETANWLKQPTAELMHLHSLCGSQQTVQVSAFRGPPAIILAHLFDSAAVNARALASEVFGRQLSAIDDSDVKMKQLEAAVMRINERYPALVILNDEVILNRLSYRLVQRHSAEEKNMAASPSRAANVNDKIVGVPLGGQRERLLFELSFGPIRRETLSQRIFDGKDDDGRRMRTVLSRLNAEGENLRVQNGWVLRGRRTSTLSKAD